MIPWMFLKLSSSCCTKNRLGGVGRERSKETSEEANVRVRARDSHGLGQVKMVRSGQSLQVL